MEEETTTLYLWDIDSDVSEPEIFDFFNEKFDTSLSMVEVHRDAKKKSLGRASLTFKNADDALAKMTTLSNLPLRSKPISMSLESFPSQSNLEQGAQPYMPRPGTPSHLNLEQGAQPYLPWPGTPSLWNLEQGAQTYMPWPGTSSQLNLEQGAQPYMPWQGTPSHLNLEQGAQPYMPWQGTPSQLNLEQGAQPYMPWQGTPSQLCFEEKVRRSVYVSNFLYELTEDGLKTMFMPYGEVVSCKIRRDRFSGKSKGDGFVEFSTHQQAVGAIALNGNKYDGRVVYVSLAKSKANLR